MSNWFITDPDGTRTRMPPCSSDYRSTKWWYDSCLHDPDVPICRTHRQFFLSRKVAHDSRPQR